MNLSIKKPFQQIPAVTVLVGLLVATALPVPAANLIWTGAVNDNWADFTAKNWLSNGVPVSYSQGGFNPNVTFNDIGEGTVNINLIVTVGSITFANNQTNYTFVASGSTFITGNTGITLNGTGTVTLNNPNSFTGDITINAGTLNLGYYGPASPQSVIYNGVPAGNLILGGGTINQLAQTSTTPLADFQNVTIMSGASTISQTARTTSESPRYGISNNVIRQVGGLVNFNPTSGNNAGIYFYNTNSLGGTSYYGVNGILGGYATIYLNDWVTAPIGGLAVPYAAYQKDNDSANWGASSNVLIGQAAGLGTAIVNVGGNTTVNTIKFTNAVSVQLDIADGQTLTLQGGGILIPTGGVLQDQINGGSLTSAQSDLVLLNQNASLVASLTISSTINGSIGLTTGGSGKTVLIANNGYTGETTINGGFGGAAAGTLQVGVAGTSGSISSSSDIVDNGILSFNRSDNITTPPISGTGNLVKLGAGVLSVTTDDTLSGLVTISSGTLQLGNGGPAGSFSNAVSIVDNANLVFDDNNTVSYSNLISSYGNLVQFGSGTLILPNNETYYGNTIVSNGTLEVNGSLAAGSAVTVSANGTLAGSGAVSGPVMDNGTIAPGSPSTIGTLTVSANPALNGTILMKLNKSVSPSNDVLAVTGTLTYGGTLDVTNIGTGTLTDGDSFKLFSAGSYSGAFSNIVPATPGAGLAWNASLLAVNGTLSVTCAPPIFAGAALSGTNFTFLVTNTVAGATNYILTSTNLALPLANWTRLATNVFDAGGNLAFTNGVDQSQPARFYLLQLP